MPVHSSPTEVTTADGARLKVLVDGTGPDLLLVSGLGGTAAFWSDVALRLRTRFRVIRFDQRGIGASSRGAAACTIEQLGADCVDVLNAVESRRAVMLGHSTGGCIGMALAVQAPDRIDGLVLSATWMRPNRHMSALFGARRALLAHDPGSYAALACLMAYPPDWLEANWHVYDAALARATMTPAAAVIARERIDALLDFDGRSHIARLALPCLVLGARDDLIVPAYLQDEIAASLPHARQAMLDSGGHFFPLTREDTFVRDLSAFVDSVA